MDHPSDEGSSPAPPAGPPARSPERSRVAARLDRVLAAALAGDASAVVKVTGGELLGEARPVAGLMATALGRPDVGLAGPWRVHELLRRSHVYDDILNGLQSPNPLTRAAAARLAGAAQLSEAVIWLGDLLEDPNRSVREASARALGDHRGARAVDALRGAQTPVPLHRLAAALSRAAPDIDIEAQIRGPLSEHAAVASVLACGLRRDLLRISPLLGIAHDRRRPAIVRLAACKALAAIGDRSAADGLSRLAENDPDETVRRVAHRAHRRLLRRAMAKPA